MLALILGFGALFIERGFAWAAKIKKSRCGNAEIEMNTT